jgi:hypothetical protein
MFTNNYQERGEIMKRNSIAILTVHMALAFEMSAANAQITIKMPDISVKGKRDKNNVTINRKGHDHLGKDTTTGKDSNPVPKTSTKASGPTSTPVFLKNSIYIQAITHNEYWKMKGKSDVSSWCRG